MLRDEQGRVHLGQDKTVKGLFARNGAGCKSFVKSKAQQCNVDLTTQLRGGAFVNWGLIHPLPQ